jgi:putative peptidoglycan lipid II flippase
VLGLAREMLLARTAGAGPATDAYNIAFLIPDMVNHFIASGYLSLTLIPLLTPLVQKQKNQEAALLFSSIAKGLMLIILVALTIGWIYTPQLLELLTHGDLDALTKTQAVRYCRIILFAQMFFLTGSLLTAVQNLHRLFLYPALAPLFYNTGIILGALFYSSSDDLSGFFIGGFMGAFIGHFCLQIIGFSKTGFRFVWQAPLFNADFFRFAFITLPFTFGMGMMFSNELIFRYFGNVTPGGVAALGYAYRIVLFLVALFSLAFGVASFPGLSELCAKGDFAQVNKNITMSVERVLALILPAGLAAIIAAPDIIYVILGREMAYSAEFPMVLVSFQLYLLTLVPLSIQVLFVRLFYASRIYWRTSLLVSSGVLLVFPFMWVFGTEISLWHIPVLSACINSLQLLILMLYWVYLHPDKLWLRFFARCLVLVIPAFAMGALGVWLDVGEIEFLLPMRWLVTIGAALMLLLFYGFSGMLDRSILQKWAKKARFFKR